MKLWDTLPCTIKLQPYIITLKNAVFGYLLNTEAEFGDD